MSRTLLLFSEIRFENKQIMKSNHQIPDTQYYRDAVDNIVKDVGYPDVFVSVVGDAVKDDTAVLGQLIIKLMYVSDHLNTKHKALLKSYKNLKNKKTKRRRVDKNQRTNKVIQEKTKLERVKETDNIVKEMAELKREKVEEKKPPELSPTVEHKAKVYSKVTIESNKIPQPKERSQSPRFTCDICQKTYSNKGNLMRHYHSHSNVIYQCKVCRRKFWHLDSLTNHEKMHEISGFKRHNMFHCNDCKKMYVSKKNLKRHQQIVHQGIRYKCDKTFCDKTFATTSSLSIHREAIHKGVKHPCNTCNKAYLHKRALKQHLLRCHFKVK